MFGVFANLAISERLCERVLARPGLIDSLRDALGSQNEDLITNALLFCNNAALHRSVVPGLVEAGLIPLFIAAMDLWAHQPVILQVLCIAVSCRQLWLFFSAHWAADPGSAPELLPLRP